MDELVSVDVQNFRSVSTLSVVLNELVVLVGENGGGKSSIIECFELLRKTTGPQFSQELERVHGGPRAMIRHGEASASLEAAIRLKPTGELCFYRIIFGGQPGWNSIVHSETLTLHPTTGEQVVLFDQAQGRPTGRARPGLVSLPDQSEELGLLLGRGNSLVDRVWRVLDGIEVHLGHEVTALWRQRERARASFSGAPSTSLRDPSPLAPAKRLAPGATNLASLFHALKNDTSPSEWDLTMRLVRLGLGANVEDVVVQVVSQMGSASVALRFSDGRNVPAAALSDGQLSFLAFVAMTRAPGERSVLLVDEPELHLHPGLVVRVFDLLDAAANRSPVLIATHSNDILDALEYPEKDLRVVALKDGKTTLSMLDPDFRDRWKARSISELRRSMGDAELVGR
jgi:predicted ATPase